MLPERLTGSLSEYKFYIFTRLQIALGELAQSTRINLILHCLMEGKDSTFLEFILKQCKEKFLACRA